jgi:hypothetical protein
MGRIYKLNYKAVTRKGKRGVDYALGVLGVLAVTYASGA